MHKQIYNKLLTTWNKLDWIIVIATIEVVLAARLLQPCNNIDNLETTNN